MNEFTIGTSQVSQIVLKERLENLAQAEHGRHWIKKDLSVAEFTFLSRIMWKVSKFLPFIRSFFDAATPQKTTLLLDGLKPQIKPYKDLTNAFNNAVVTYERLTHQKVAAIETPSHAESPKPVEPLSLKSQVIDAKEYDPKKTKTVSQLFDMKKLMADQYKGHAGMRKQGDDLSKSYYFQNCRGGGDCFYLGYISGWLHHLAQAKAHDPQVFQNAIGCLQKHSNEKTSQVIKLLQDLDQKTDVENLYKHLLDEAEMKAFVQCLRFIACKGVMTMDDGKDGLQYDDDAIRANILGNTELEPLLTNSSIKNVYCEHQRKMGENVQAPEIAVLSRWIAPLSICFSQDHQEASLQGKFAAGYEEERAITLFQRNNHFDVLISKKK